MPFYQNLDPSSKDGKRALQRLLELREDLRKNIPEKQLDKTLLLATWNIREFDSGKYGVRTEECYYYIAEIISKFDIVAIQEVNADLSALKRLMEILGSSWEYMVTDTTEGVQGNKERTAFVFDNRKVRFGGLAGELVLPAMQRKDPKSGQMVAIQPRQLARTPYMCGFKAGWTNFILTTVHIIYGKDAANDPERIREIDELARFMARRADDTNEWSRNIVLLGDFNIYSPTDETYDALTKAKFTVPDELQNLPSNIGKNKFYDQIAFKVRPKRFETTGKAGVFDFFNTVFKEEDEKEYATLMGAAYKDSKSKARYYKDWRTFQMSDHYPMWVEIKIDHTDNYLRSKMAPPQKDETATVAAPSVPAIKKLKKKVTNTTKAK